MHTNRVRLSSTICVQWGQAERIPGTEPDWGRYNKGLELGAPEPRGWIRVRLSSWFGL